MSINKDFSSSQKKKKGDDKSHSHALYILAIYEPHLPTYNHLFLFFNGSIIPSCPDHSTKTTRKRSRKRATNPHSVLSLNNSIVDIVIPIKANITPIKPSIMNATINTFNPLSSSFISILFIIYS